MKKQKECVAMLLAGGEGSRLQPLTQYLAKPAVPFGGKYRIVDFTLSNCANSGIDTVGVLTQYQPLLLNEYIGNGQPWDLDRNFGGVQILPPYKAKRGGEWYHGTANAVWQNRHFIERYAPKYVLVLSGDHIYRMNYRALIERHKSSMADCTIAVIDVPLDEASRFGILTTDEKDVIVDFEEKPKEPKSTLASMGIYVFNTEYLFSYLEKDEADKSSKNDFGKNVIPSMLDGGGRLAAYRFSGYWRDVGTLESLWQANMDLVGDHPVFDLFMGNGRIFSRSDGSTPQYVGDSGSVTESILSQGCRVYGRVERSVLSPNVVVEKGAVVRDSILMNGVRVKQGAQVQYAILDEQVSVEADARIGDGKELCVIGRGGQT